MKKNLLNPIVFLNQKTAVNINEVLFLEGNVNYTIIHLEGKHPITIASTLKKIESKLKGYNFLRIHKRFLLNMTFADRSLLSNNRLLIKKNIAITVSRRKRSELKDWLTAA
ncbi:LytTR family DNA-binding domain-containing protein [Emticicia sp. BO119]|uniref:LytR/AlgR family response regulator transcription factor n=1 Tax=Emticicia sp. BO119 TaxID=2757768 RepID=UPI0015F047CD|nr:LytTR family DNA-binding domain-containing protein [Emticicia sp. BO119]MBA4849279.1 LytTR family transcriptional regulator DNA-binding domain-containing protein [Emticicia sp. BO119]